MSSELSVTERNWELFKALALRQCLAPQTPEKHVVSTVTFSYHFSSLNMSQKDPCQKQACEIQKCLQGTKCHFVFLVSWFLLELNSFNLTPFSFTLRWKKASTLASPGCKANKIIMSGFNRFPLCLLVSNETPLVQNRAFVTVMCLFQSVLHAGSEIPCVVLGLSCRQGELDIIISSHTEWVVR